jgi:hypothetical protein
MREITFHVTLTDVEAWQFAQLPNLVCFSDYRQRSMSEDEAYIMLQAGEKIRSPAREGVRTAVTVVSAP